MSRGGFRQTLYVTPGSPCENPYCESFNSRFRDEFLNREEFTSELEAKVVSAEWRRDYNGMRPRSALRGQTPADCGARCRASFGAAPLPAHDRAYLPQPQPNLS